MGRVLNGSHPVWIGTCLPLPGVCSDSTCYIQHPGEITFPTSTEEIFIPHPSGAVLKAAACAHSHEGGLGRFMEMWETVGAAAGDRPKQEDGSSLGLPELLPPHGVIASCQARPPGVEGSETHELSPPPPGSCPGKATGLLPSSLKGAAFFPLMPLLEP